MTRKVKNGRRLLVDLLAGLSDIAAATAIDLRAVKYDPKDAYDRLQQIGKTAEVMRDQIQEELAPMLDRIEERREMPERVAELERTVAELRELIEARTFSIVPPRRTGTE